MKETPLSKGLNDDLTVPERERLEKQLKDEKKRSVPVQPDQLKQEKSDD